MTTPITVAYGDGSAEIMEAALTVLREAGADITVESIEIGQRIYNMGGTKGILPSSWEVLKRTNILFKGPTNPAPEGFIEVSTAIRQRLGEEFPLFEIVADNATPVAALRLAIGLLEHIGQQEVASRIAQALERIPSSRKPLSPDELVEAMLDHMYRKLPAGAKG